MSIGPSRPLVLEKPDAIDLQQAARYFGQRGPADEATASLLERCAVPILAAATPRAVWLEGDVQSLAEAGLLLGEDVFRHLTGCSHAVLLAVTLGPGVDAQIRRAGWGHRGRGGVGCAGLGIGRADGRCRRGGAAPVGRRAGQVSDGPLFARLRRLAHHGAAAGGRSTGHRPPGGPLRDGQQPDDAPQERHGAAGRQRPSGPGASGRVRPLCAAHPLRISKEGNHLCK